jgi:DNA-binding transcriptional MerR regulator
MAAPDDGLLPLDEAAAHAGVSKRKLQRWLSEGHLTKHTRAGDQRTFIKVTELLDAMRTVPHQRRRQR